MACQVSLVLAFWCDVACSKGLNLKQVVIRRARNHVSLLSGDRVLQYLGLLLKLLA